MADTAAASGPVAAIIPARGGSKRIPRKNIRSFRGVPLIARTIGALLEAELFDRIIVSTDDEEIAAIAAEAGAKAPFRRPDDLADDHTGTAEVMRHAIRQLEAIEDIRLELICSVYPGAVFTRPEDLRTALSILRLEGADFVFSATSFGYPIQRALRRLPNGACEMLHPEHRMTRSQDLEEAFHDAGQFYWGRRDAWLEAREVLSPASRLFLLPRSRVQDIDTPEDWERAELLHRLLEEQT